MIFVGIALKLENVWSNFFKFQPISVLAIRSNRRQETLSGNAEILNNKTESVYFLLRLMRRRVLLFKMIVNTITTVTLREISQRTLDTITYLKCIYFTRLRLAINHLRHGWFLKTTSKWPDSLS